MNSSVLALIAFICGARGTEGFQWEAPVLLDVSLDAPDPSPTPSASSFTVAGGHTFVIFSLSPEPRAAGQTDWHTPHCLCVLLLVFSVYVAVGYACSLYSARRLREGRVGPKVDALARV